MIYKNKLTRKEKKKYNEIDNVSYNTCVARNNVYIRIGIIFYCYMVLL